MYIDTVEALSAHGSIRAAAKALGCSRSTVRRRLATVVPDTQKALVLADLHVPYHDEEALELALEYGRRINPDVVVLLGDFADFYDVSSWSKDPYRMRFPDEVDLSAKMLAEIGKMFPGARKVYLEGNHESRMTRFLWGKAEQLYGLNALAIPELLKCGLSGWEYINNAELLAKNERPFRLGKLTVMHGHEIRVSGGAVNLARLYYLKTHTNLMVAHHHQPQEYIARKLVGGHDGCWCVGSLCQLAAEYMPVNNWCHGLATVEWSKDGSFEVRNRKIIRGKVL